MVSAQKKSFLRSMELHYETKGYISTSLTHDDEGIVDKETQPFLIHLKISQLEGSSDIDIRTGADVKTLGRSRPNG
jgi:hypothetical protein